MYIKLFFFERRISVHQGYIFFIKNTLIKIQILLEFKIVFYLNIF